MSCQFEEWSKRKKKMRKSVFSAKGFPLSRFKVSVRRRWLCCVNNFLLRTDVVYLFNKQRFILKHNFSHFSNTIRDSITIQSMGSYSCIFHFKLQREMKDSYKKWPLKCLGTISLACSTTEICDINHLWVLLCQMYFLIYWFISSSFF